jgi:hypothetical protein
MTGKTWLSGILSWEQGQQALFVPSMGQSLLDQRKTQLCFNLLNQELFQNS